MTISHSSSSDFDLTSMAHGRPYGVMSKRKGSPVAHALRSKKMSPTLPMSSVTLQHMEDVRDEQQHSSRRERTISAYSCAREVSELFEMEYQDDIHEYMEEMESKTLASTEHMDMQPELEWSMRPCLVNFLIGFHLHFRLRPETLYLALNIVDRYVSKRIVYRKHYQLVGCAALWIAAKFEDSKERVPTVEDLAQMCCGAYEEGAFIQMEGHVLVTIGWIIGHPTAEAWLRYYGVRPNIRDDQKTLHIAKYLMEHTLLHRTFVKYRTSRIAAASLHLARVINGKGMSSLLSKDILQIVKELELHVGPQKSTQVPDNLLKKYSMDGFSRAAEIVAVWYTKGNTYDSTIASQTQHTGISCATPKAYLPTPPRSSGRFALHRKNPSSVSMNVEEVIHMINRAAKENVPPSDDLLVTHNSCHPAGLGRRPFASANWELNRTEVIG